MTQTTRGAAPYRVNQRPIGFNIGLPSSAGWTDPYQDRGPLQSFYVQDGASGVLDLSTGRPVSGNTKLTIQLRGGVKWEDGSYAVSWTGGGTVNSQASPITLVVAGPDDEVTYTCAGEISNFSIVPQAGVTGTYTDSFAERASHGNCIRFMESSRINENGGPSAASFDTDHPYMRRRTVVGGNDFLHPSITPTMMGAMCGHFQKDLWICFHHLSTDQNVTDAITDIINTGFNRSILVEYSNEAWNPDFPQRAYMLAEAIASGDYETAPGDTARIAAYHADRSHEVVGVAKAASDTCVGVLGCWNAVPNTYNSFQDYGIHAPFVNIDAYAIAPYYGGPPCRALSRAAALALDAAGLETICRDDFGTRVAPLSASWKVYADAANVPLYCYESGSSAENDDSDAEAHMSALSNSAEMGVLMGDFFDWWNDTLGGQLVVVFQGAGSPTEPWSFHAGELGPVTGRWQAVLDRVR